MEEFNLQVFKETFAILNPEMLDVMSFEKGNKLDEWIEKTFLGLQNQNQKNNLKLIRLRSY